MDISINSQESGYELTIEVSGRIDINTSAGLEKFINEKFLNVSYLKKLILDLAGVTYISSAGLRVIIATQKAVNKVQGVNRRSLVLKSPSDFCMQVFQTVGADSFLTIEA